MHEVQTNAELAAFHAGGAGLVFNHFTSGPAAGRDNVLHMAGCPQVGRMLARVRPESRPRARKVLFATAEEAQSWLTVTLGPEGHRWRLCARCQTGGPAQRTPPSQTRTVMGTAGAGPAAAAAGPARLASWNRADHPDQTWLAGYLDAAEDPPAPVFHPRRSAGAAARRRPAWSGLAPG